MEHFKHHTPNSRIPRGRIQNQKPMLSKILDEALECNRNRVRDKMLTVFTFFMRCDLSVLDISLVASFVSLKTCLKAAQKIAKEMNSWEGSLEWSLEGSSVGFRGGLR